MDIKRQLHELVEKYPDSTLSEYCEYWGNIYGQWISPSTMCRELKRLGLTKKKDATKQSIGDRNGAKIKKKIMKTLKTIHPENLVFID
jgi:transposase